MSPGEVANLDANARLSVPAGVLKLVAWWKQETADVVAELVEEGLVRIYSLAEADHHVVALRQAVLDLPPEERFEVLATIADRYRQLKLYGDGRLGLTKDVAQVLGFRLKVDKPTLYTQAFPAGFEVMSLSFRLRRLERNKQFVIALSG